MTAATSQAAWDALRRERDDLLLAIDRCEETKTALHLNLREARRERDELAAQVEVMRDALENARQWHQGDKWRDSDDEANLDAWQIQMNRIDGALALPNTAADILRKRDARVIRQFAAVLLQSKPPLVLPFAERYANELERKNG